LHSFFTGEMSSEGKVIAILTIVGTTVLAAYALGSIKGPIISPTVSPSDKPIIQATVQNEQNAATKLGATSSTTDKSQSIAATTMQQQEALLAGHTLLDPKIPSDSLYDEYLRKYKGKPIISNIPASAPAAIMPLYNEKEGEYQRRMASEKKALGRVQNYLKEEAAGGREPTVIQAGN
jgi:hypothetical protein